MSFKPYEKYKDSGVDWIGKIPNHWKVIKFKYVCDLINGFAFESDSFEEEGIPVIRIGDITEDMTLENAKKVNRNNLKKLKRFIVKRNDVLLALSGATVGKSSIYNSDEVALLNQRVAALRTKLDKLFFYYVIKSEKFQEGLKLEAFGSAQENIGKDQLNNLYLPIPSIDEQVKIGAFINEKFKELQNIIQLKIDQIKTLQKYRQSLITETVTRGLNPNVKMKDSGVKWIGTIPEHWEVKKLKHIADVRLSNVDKKSIEDEIPVYLCNYVDVYYNDEISDKIEFMQATAKPEQIDKFTLKQNDVLITKDSESPTDIAVPAWVSMDLENVLCGYHLALIRPFNGLDGKYLFYSLKSTRISEQFYAKANGVTRFGLGKDAIKNGLIPFPPLSEQITIGNYLYSMSKKLNSLIVSITEQIEILKKYRQSLIYEAVTGKIDVRNYNGSELEVKL
jgi:type I restriction enzyme, S subunit